MRTPDKGHRRRHLVKLHTARFSALRLSTQIRLKPIDEATEIVGIVIKRWHTAAAELQGDMGNRSNPVKAIPMNTVR